MIIIIIVVSISINNFVSGILIGKTYEKNLVGIFILGRNNSFLQRSK